MRLICILIMMMSLGIVSAQTSFTQAALNEEMVAQDDSKITFEEILAQERGKYVFIDIWSSWCGSCYIKLSEVKKLQQLRPDVSYVFLSVEGSQIRWQQTLEKLTVTGKHYYVASYLQGDFAKSILLKQIPRYLIVDPTGKLVSLDASNLSINQINALLNEN
ncbi:MAG: TlpA family protein disulfide reductase [Gilvibacter sp.]